MHADGACARRRPSTLARTRRGYSVALIVLTQALAAVERPEGHLHTGNERGAMQRKNNGEAVLGAARSGMTFTGGSNPGRRHWYAVAAHTRG